MAAADSTRQAIWAERRRQRRKSQQEIDRVKREEVRAEKRRRTEKLCPKCGVRKERSSFGLDESRPDGLKGWCKACRTASSADWRAKNIDASRAATARWQKNNRERRRAIVNKSQLKARSTEIGRLSIRVRNGVRWSITNGKQGKRTFDLLDFTLDDLKRHLERQFHDGMTWDALMTGAIHIDHIRPLSSFNIDSPTCAEFKQAWALSNLRPLWARDNLKKSGSRLYLI